MKKLLYVFIAASLLISCDSDNDTDLDLDPIIGTWQLESMLENGVEETTECERKSILTFLENGNVSISSFYNDGNGCNSETDSSSWVNTSDSFYKIDDDPENVNITFSENNTVFTISFSETFDGETYSSVIKYKKI